MYDGFQFGFLTLPLLKRNLNTNKAAYVLELRTVGTQ